MIKRLSVAVSLSLIAISPIAEASMKWISTHQSMVFTGDGALNACDLEAKRLEVAFPVEAAEKAEITLIDVVCTPAGDKRVRLGIVYEHGVADEIATIVDRMESPESCAKATLAAQTAFTAAGLAPVVIYCSASDVVVDFIDPLRVSHSRYVQGPRFSSRAECGARYERLARDFRAAGFAPLVGSCQEFKGLIDEKTYFVTSFAYASPLALRVETLHARATRLLSECLGDFDGLRERFAGAGLPVVDAYCADDSAGFHQVVSYADGNISKLRTHDGGVSVDLERCERTRERVTQTLAKQGNAILHSYCEELRPFAAEAGGFRYRVHYTEIKQED